MAEAGGAVVLLSGGLDSTVLLHYVARRLGRRPLYALSFQYGQKHGCELAMARWQAEHLPAMTGHTIIELDFYPGLVAGSSALVGAGAPVPELRELPPEARRQPPTYVPNRNLTLLALAAAAAEARGCAEVYYGAQAQDEYGYWDCTEEFLTRVNAVLALNRRTPVRVLAPFVDWPKSREVGLGLELGVDFSHTWSCYRGGAVHCGRCPTCVERRTAFRAAGVADPTVYEPDAG